MKFIINILHKSKSWVESFANKPYAMPAIFILSFAESSFFPIPPDVLLIAIAVSAPQKALQAAMWCTLGSVLGGIVGYYIGWGLMETVGNQIVEFYQYQDKWDLFISRYREFGPWFLGAAAFTPIPYKVSTIASGAAEMNLLLFSTISFLGRGARFFLVAGLLYWAGPKIKPFIDKYFDKLSIAFLVLLIGGFIVIKYLI